MSVQKALTKTQAINEVTKELRRTIAAIDKDDWLSVATIGNSKCLGGVKLEADKCVSLINRCMSGTDLQGCVSEWSDLNVANGIEWDNLDTASARILLEKMGIDVNKSNAVDSFLKSKSITLDEKLTSFLKVLVAKVSNPQAPRPEIVAAVSVVPTIQRRVAVTAIQTGGMVGGGVNTSSNYIQMSDFVRNQLVMIGGSPVKTSTLLRAMYADLKNALNNHDKSIEANDDSRILALIDNLERTEQKVEKAMKYIIALRRLANQPKEVVNKEIPGPEVTAAMMVDLESRYKALTSSQTKKTATLQSILDTIATQVPQLQKDVADIKAMLAKAPAAAPAVAGTP